MPRSTIRRFIRHGTLPQLAVFDAIARHGSFTRAAEELYLAQPTVSIQMKKLSETVGVALIEQVGKRAVLTLAGEELHAACNDVFERFALLEERLAGLRAPPGADDVTGERSPATETAGDRHDP